MITIRPAVSGVVVALVFGLTISVGPPPVSAETTLMIVWGSGEFRSLDTAITVSQPEAISLQWSTDQPGAAGGKWEVTTSRPPSRPQVVASGAVTHAPRPGHMAVFTIAANSFLRAAPPAQPAKYTITITPHDAQNNSLGGPSAAVVVTQVKSGPGPTFGRSAVFPKLVLLHYREQIGMVHLTQLHFALGVLRVRAVNDGRAVTDSMSLSVRDDHVLMRHEPPAATIPSLKPGGSIEVTLRVKAVLPPPQSQLPEEQQYRQWGKQYRERGGVDLRGVMSWSGPQAQAPMNPYREVPLYEGLGDSTPCQEGKASPESQPPDVPMCVGNQCVSLREVSRKIHQRLDCRVVGYAFFVGRSPTFEAFGKARTAANAPARDFTPATKMTVASVSKVVTALAAVRVLAMNGVRLKDTIGRFLPEDWSVDPNVAMITFGELLSHKSGIKDYGNNAQDYATIRTFFTQSVDVSARTECMGADVVNPRDPIVVDPAKKAEGCYSNYNSSIFRVLLPRVAGFRDNDPAKLATKYVELVQKTVFEPVGITGVECRPPAQPGSAYAFAYAFPGSSSGQDWGDNTLSCGHAGWYLSVEDIATVLVSLNTQDAMPGTGELSIMEANSLGWDMPPPPGFRLHKNGAWGRNGALLTTSIAIVGPAPGIVGVLFINSDIAREPNVGADTVLWSSIMKALRAKP